MKPQEPYVCGFAFEDDTRSPHIMPRTLLARKTTPKIQEGWLYGIQGIGSMPQVFFDTCGIETVEEDWCKYYIGASEVFYTTKLKPAVYRSARSVTKTPVVSFSMCDWLGLKHIQSLRYLIPMAWLHLNDPSLRTLI